MIIMVKCTDFSGKTLWFVTFAGLNYVFFVYVHTIIKLKNLKITSISLFYTINGGFIGEEDGDENDNENNNEDEDKRKDWRRRIPV